MEEQLGFLPLFCQQIKGHASADLRSEIQACFGVFGAAEDLQNDAKFQNLMKNNHSPLHNCFTAVDKIRNMEHSGAFRNIE